MTLSGISGCEMQITKEFLGLTTGWLAKRLKIRDRRLRRMEAEDEDIPQIIITFLDDLYEETRQLVNDMTAQYRREVHAAWPDEVTLETYRTDQEYATVGGVYPARWHRQLCARVALAVPGLVLVHAKGADDSACVEAG